MISLLLDQQAAIEALCRKYHVASLEAFGSAVTGTFDTAKSDLDFLVRFSRALAESGLTTADQYFGLLFDLEDLFQRRIDLVSAKAMRNPYFIKSVNAQRRVLYAA